MAFDNFWNCSIYVKVVFGPWIFVVRSGRYLSCIFEVFLLSSLFIYLFIYIFIYSVIHFFSISGFSFTNDHHFHSFHRHLDIDRVTNADSSPLHLTSSRLEPGTYGFSVRMYFVSKLREQMMMKLWFRNSTETVNFRCEVSIPGNLVKLQNFV